MLSMPAWLTERFGGAAVWQWLNLAIYLLLVILWVANCNFARKNGQMTNLAPAGCLPYPVEL